MFERGGACGCAAALLIAAVAHPSVVHARDQRIRDWLSPDRRTRISSVAEQAQFALILRRAGHPPVVIDEYARDVDVSFSPNSAYVAVTDWIGSNLADCYVIATRDPERRYDMARLLPKLAQDVSNAHFYVACLNWRGSSHIAVRAEGHTDDPPVHDFSYDVEFDIGARMMRQTADHPRAP